MTMGRLYKRLVFWAQNEGEAQPQVARMQLDTGADRTVLAKLPPGAVVKGEGCINGKPVDLVDVFMYIPKTACQALVEVAVPKVPRDLPPVIGHDFYQATDAVIDYRDHKIGCPARPPSRKAGGFAGGERLGIMKFTPGPCPAPRAKKKKRASRR